MSLTHTYVVCEREGENGEKGVPPPPAHYGYVFFFFVSIFTGEFYLTLA